MTDLPPDKYDKLVNDLGEFTIKIDKIKNDLRFTYKWSMGNIIYEYLGDKQRCPYGKHVIQQAAKEIGRHKSSLYDCWLLRCKFESVDAVEKANPEKLGWRAFCEKHNIGRKQKEPTTCECGGNFKKTLVCEKCGKRKG